MFGLKRYPMSLKWYLYATQKNTYIADKFVTNLFPFEVMCLAVCKWLLWDADVSGLSNRTGNFGKDKLCGQNANVKIETRPQ